MALPVDTTNITVLCGGPPQPVVDRVTGEHKSNREGQALYRTEVVVLGAGRPEVLGVRTATPPRALAIGAPLAVSGLTVSTFTAKDGGTGVFYEAASIEPAKAQKEAS